jgi:hypothetical protein
MGMETEAATRQRFFELFTVQIVILREPQRPKDPPITPALPSEAKSAHGFGRFWQILRSSRLPQDDTKWCFQIDSLRMTGIDILEINHLLSVCGSKCLPERPSAAEGLALSCRQSVDAEACQT